MESTEQIKLNLNKYYLKIQNLNNEYKLLIVFIILILIYYIYKYFKNKSDKNKSDDCIFISMKNCGFCEKQTELFKSDNNKLNNNIKITIIDSNCEQAQNLINKYNIKGFPAII